MIQNKIAKDGTPVCSVLNTVALQSRTAGTASRLMFVQAQRIMTNSTAPATNTAFTSASHFSTKLRLNERSVVEDNVEKRTMDFKLAVVANEAQFPEPVHEEIDS